MRVLIACLLLVSTGLPLDQNSRDLRSRFGEPDIERYTATNDIGLTLEYGSDGLACQIVIERKQPLLHGIQAQQYMPPEVVSTLTDEIVPPAGRGRHINTLLESMGCAEVRVEEYENVWIGRYADTCLLWSARILSGLNAFAITTFPKQETKLRPQTIQDVTM